MTGELTGFVATLTAMRGAGGSLPIYEEWAGRYDSEMQGDYGYVGHRIAAAALASACPDPEARVLDMGCGTGLVGQELAARGYGRIDGLDISPAMLEQARAKHVYGELLVADLMAPIDLGGRVYDAAVAVGCFGGGHVGPEHLGNMIDCVMPGGLLVLYINGIPYDEEDYPARFRALEAAGRWQVLTAEESNYMQALTRPGWAVVARRTGGGRNG